MSSIVSTNALLAPMTQLGIQTPPPTPSTSLPLHGRTRALLRATCNTSSEIAGRISERQSIRDFIAAFIGSRTDSGATDPVLYISGSPGCGKTALVNSMLATFEAELLANSISTTLINCMALNGLDAVWDRLLEELGSSTKRGCKTRSSEAVEGLLASQKSKWFVSSSMSDTRRLTSPWQCPCS
ncbi:hypothetical protein BC834DRAFT_866427 [Gloeopeniophorella convolvens]|nr:hypothetical protein BC834DRAFT_866427 [Gloeopeniophorella convolvens]